MIDRPQHPTQGHAAWPSFLEPLQTVGTKIADFFSPTSEAAKSVENYEINMELPGVDESDIDVALDGNMLTISGEKKSEHEEKGKTFFFSERTFGTFQRSFRVPDDVDTSKIGADFAKGVLTVTLPKTAPSQSDQRKISVRAEAVNTGF